VSSAWASSWGKSWGNAWGLLTGQSTGGSHGWILQQFTKRPWELERKEVEAAYRRLVNHDVVEVKKVVKPFVHKERINWAELMVDVSAVEAIIRMEIKRLEDEEEEELLIMLLSY